MSLYAWKRFLHKYYRTVLVLLPLFGIGAVVFLLQYINFSSETVIAKWGTIVEGVFNTVSTVPYLDDQRNSRFYTSLLFSSCLDYDYVKGEPVLTGGICSIQTEDEKTYHVAIWTGEYYWSDGTPVTNKDLYTTYKKVLIDNQRDLPRLTSYANIELRQGETAWVTLSFPVANVDNRSFFLNFLLPAHVVQDMTYQQYRDHFVDAPLTNTCVKPREGADANSLIFDVGWCDDTYLWYYQLKYFPTFDKFYNKYLSNGNIQDGEELFIDLYHYNQQLPEYKRYNIVTKDYMTLFFNTTSERLSKRIQRSLWGLFMHTFFSWNYHNYIHKDQLMLDTFLSKGEDIKENILSHNPNLDVEKKDLERINVSQLPSSLTIAKEAENFVYYAEGTGLTTLDISLSGDLPEYKKVALQLPHQTWWQKITLTPSQWYALSLSGVLKEGLNKFMIKADKEVVTYEDGEEKKEISFSSVANIDIYYFPQNTNLTGDIPPHQRIKCIYYKDMTSTYLIQQFIEILEDQDIRDFFLFVGYTDIKEFEQKIASKDYDMVLRSIYFGLQKDISNFLLTDDPLINPSLYKNQHLSSLINKYVNIDDSNIQQATQHDIATVYGNDMPFVIFGPTVDPIYLHRDNELYPAGIQDKYSWKKHLYENIQLMKRSERKKDRIFSGQNVFRFWNDQRE